MGNSNGRERPKGKLVNKSKIFFWLRVEKYMGLIKICVPRTCMEKKKKNQVKNNASLNTERSCRARLRYSASKHKFQRTTNAPIWLANSLKSNFSALPQNSVFPFSAEISLETKTSFKKNRYKQTVKVINHIYGNMFIFLASYLKEIP